ncbi:MAG: OsmC family protein [Nitrososphaeraceae archaeon]
MSNITNNVDLNKISKTIEEGRNDLSTLRRPVKLAAEWNLNPDKPYQFKTELAYEKGKQVIEIDSPSFLGGNGNRLGPMAYCVAGITSCFIATFVTVASSKGIRLSKLNVNAQCNINFAKTFDIADEPITEGIEFQIEAESQDADKQQLEEIIGLAEKRCPAMYSMMHEIKVNAIIK